MATKRLKTKGKGVCGASLEERLTELERAHHNLAESTDIYFEADAGLDDELLKQLDDILARLDALETASQAHTDRTDTWVQYSLDLERLLMRTRRDICPWYSRLWLFLKGGR